MKDKNQQKQYTQKESSSTILPRIYLRPSSIKRNKQYKIKTQQSINQSQLIDKLQKQLNISSEFKQNLEQQKNYETYAEQNFNNLFVQKQPNYPNIKSKSFGITSKLPQGLKKIPLKLKIKQRPVIISSMSGSILNNQYGYNNIKKSHSSLKKILFNLKEANIYTQAFKGCKSRKTLSQQHKQMTQNQKLVQKLLLLKPSKDISRESQLASYRQHQKYRNIMSHSYSKLKLQNSKQRISNKIQLAHRFATKKLIIQKKQPLKNNVKKQLNIKDIILIPQNQIGITIAKYKSSNLQPKTRNIRQKEKNSGYSYHQRQKTTLI